MNPFQAKNFMKTFTVLLFFSASILLTGCWDRREVNDTAIVLSAAIDKENGKNIKLTVQVLIPRAVSSGQQGTAGSGGGNLVLVRSAIGENMADAASKLQTEFPRKIFWGHCKIYIISKKLAKGGRVREQIDFLLRHPEPRERAFLFVSDEEAGKLLKLQPPLEKYLGEELRKLSEMHIGVNITVKDFEQMLISDAETAFLPLVKKLPPASGQKQDETIVYMIGTAIFKKGKMIGHIDTKATRGLLWLRNEIEVTSVTITSKKGERITIDPIRETTELLPTIKNGEWKILAKIRSEGSIVQNGTHLDVMSPTITKRIEKDLEKEIKQRINLSVIQVKKGMNADAFGFAEAFHRKYPKEWQKVKDHWDEIIPQVDMKINIKTRVRWPGLSTTPAGLKEEEIEKK